jgi:hypothetical protein
MAIDTPSAVVIVELQSRHLRFVEPLRTVLRNTGSGIFSHNTPQRQRAPPSPNEFRVALPHVEWPPIPL